MTFLSLSVRNGMKGAGKCNNSRWSPKTVALPSAKRVDPGIWVKGFPGDVVGGAHPIPFGHIDAATAVNISRTSYRLLVDRSPDDRGRRVGRRRS